MIAVAVIHFQPYIDGDHIITQHFPEPEP